MKNLKTFSELNENANHIAFANQYQRQLALLNDNEELVKAVQDHLGGSEVKYGDYDEKTYDAFKDFVDTFTDDELRRMLDAIDHKSDSNANFRGGQSTRGKKSNEERALKTFSELYEKIYQVSAGDEKMVADYIKSSIEDGVKDIPSIVHNFNMDHDSGVGHDDFRRIAQKFNIKIDMYTSKDVQKAIDDESIIVVGSAVFSGDPRQKHTQYGDAPIELVPRVFNIDPKKDQSEMSFIGDDKECDQYEAKIKDIIEIK